MVKLFRPIAIRPFGVGPQRKPCACVEDTPRLCVYDLRGIAASPLSPLAREATVRVVIDGRTETLEVVWEPRYLGGDGQRFFLCPCSRKVRHLYARADEPLRCRRCARLSYRSKHTRRQGINRVRRLREKIGALPSPLAPIPPRPLGWRKDYWLKTIAKLGAAEAVIAAELRAMVPRVRRRLKRDRDSAAT